MGIVQKQTLKGSLYTYLGAFLGFITTAILMPKLLSKEQVGLVNMLNDLALVFAVFASLGFSSTIRYFPYFRNSERKHHGYLFLACAAAAVGFLLVCLVIWLFKDQIISQETQKSLLFADYYYYLIPITFFTLFFNVFELYARAHYEAIVPRFLREFLRRIFGLAAFLLLFLGLVDFTGFMPLWLVTYILPTLILFWYISRMDGFSLRPDYTLLDKDMRKKLVYISLFGILAGAAPTVISLVDKYMVNQVYGLSMTGIYSISMLFGGLITMPSRSLYSISLPLVSEAWKSNDTNAIKVLYQKSSINQLFIALLLFIGVWGNIHNVFAYLPDYEAGKYVIFFVGLYSVIDMGTGINGVIISTSKYYRYDTLFYVSLIAFTIGANLIFIPIYGMVGAAMATALTYGLFNLFRYLFVWKMFKMQPFTWHTLGMVLVAAAVYFGSLLIPVMGNFIVDIAIRSTIMGSAYIAATYYLRLSPDFNRIVDGWLEKRFPKNKA